MSKGDGVFKIRNNKIYVHGTIHGKFYRKSTGKKVTNATKVWMKKADPLKVLSELLGIATNTNYRNYTLKEIALETIEMQFKTNKISEKHYKDKLQSLYKHTFPYFQNLFITDITVNNIVDWILYLKENLSDSRAKFNKNLLASVFRYAYHDLQILDRNIFETETVRRISFDVKNVDTEAYNIKEVAKILKEATGWLKVYLDLSFKYGFRPGEIMVLKWEDFDLENGIVTLKRSLSVDNIIVEYNNKNKKSGNKNHFRKIPLFPKTVLLLKSFYEVRPHNEWLFVNKDNNHFVQSSSIINYHLKPLLRRINVKYKTLYATRRSYISIMSFSGEDLEKIQEVVGHSKGSSVTEDYYITEEILGVEELKERAKHQEKLFHKFLDS